MDEHFAAALRRAVGDARRAGATAAEILTEVGAGYDAAGAPRPAWEEPSAGTVPARQAAVQLDIDLRTIDRLVEAGHLDRGEDGGVTAASLRDWYEATREVTTVMEAAEQLGVSQVSIYRYLEDGRLTEHPTGSGRRGVTRASVEAYLAGSGKRAN